MTKEERESTIDYLEGIKEKYIEGEGYERHPLPEWFALEMAIKELKQEHCEDAISRAEAQTEIEMNASRYTIAKERGGMGQVEWSDQLIKVSDALDTIRHLPSVTPQPKAKWVPVSKMLPEKDGEYLLFGKIDEDEENYIFIGEYDACAEQFGIWQEQFDKTTLGCLGSEFFEYSSVIAWQTLPQPYREDEHRGGLIEVRARKQQEERK